MQVSFAAFEGNDLAGCLDVVAEIVSPDGAAFDRAHEESVLESMLTAGKKDAKKGTMKLSRIRQPCINQFGDRTVFARCAYQFSKDPSRGQFSIFSSIYSFQAAFGNDKAMRNCMENEGEWSAIPRTSPEFQEARLHHDMGSLRRLVDQAARQDP